MSTVIVDYEMTLRSILEVDAVPLSSLCWHLLPCPKSMNYEHMLRLKSKNPKVYDLEKINKAKAKREQRNAKRLKNRNLKRR